MVIQSVGLMAGSNVLLARQYKRMSRFEVKHILGQFAGMVDRDGRDVNFMDGPSVRYLFQRMNGCCLVLVTDKYSNVLEDTATLNLLYKMIGQLCNGEYTPESLCAHIFDIVWAIDELVPYGFNDSRNLDNMKEIVEMDSSEDKIERMIQENKEKEEKRRRKQIALKLDRQYIAEENAKKLAMMQSRGHAPTMTDTIQESLQQAMGFARNAKKGDAGTSPPGIEGMGMGIRGGMGGGMGSGISGGMGSDTSHLPMESAGSQVAQGRDLKKPQSVQGMKLTKQRKLRAA